MIRLTRDAQKGAKLLSKTLKKKNLTQTDLAEWLDVTPQTVSLWVCEEMPIHPKHCKAICKFLDDDITPVQLRYDIFGGMM